MGFDLGRTIEAKAREFTPWPMGRYNAFIESANGTTSQNGSTGVEFVFRITGDEFGGKYIGRTYTERLYLDGQFVNDTAKATRYGILSDIGAKVGVESFSNTDALVNGELCLVISQRKTDWDGKERIRNVVQSYDYTDPNLKPKQQNQQQRPQQQQGGGEMDWDTPF